MATPLADVASLEARLGRALDSEETALAEAALKAASAKVRHYGLPWPDPSTAPDVAVETVLDVAERKVRNPEGFRQEMEGGYQYLRPAGEPAALSLSPAEIRMVRAAAGIRGVFSVPISSFGGEA